MIGKKSNKKKKETEQDQAAAAQLNSDLIVHNMPKASSLSGLFSSPASLVAQQPISDPSAGGSVLPTQAKHNFKAVGFMIIGGGLVVIGAIVYLTYHFIISPAANQNKAADINQPTAENKNVATSSAPVTPPADITPATDLTAATTTVVAVATTSSATSSEMISSNPGAFADSDGDSLNDVEEAILGTSATSTDTDGDNYADSAEVLSGYNPAGSGKLSTNPNLITYTNTAFGYDILYPKTWPVKSINNDATIIFTAPDDSLIQISTQENPDKVGILSWYEEAFPNITVTYDKVRSTYSWEGIMGADGSNFYLTDKRRTNIFVISYIPAVEGRIAYPNIFQLLINSLFIK